VKRKVGNGRGGGGDSEPSDLGAKRKRKGKIKGENEMKRKRKRNGNGLRNRDRTIFGHDLPHMGNSMLLIAIDSGSTYNFHFPGLAQPIGNLGQPPNGRCPSINQ
jgi:hypothetical protein